MRYFWRSICRALVLALLCGVLLPAAQPALARQPDAGVIQVNSSADAPDANLNDGRCAAPAGACTLRAAIMQANAAGAPQTIELPQGVYTLTIASDDPANDQGVRDLDIFGSLTIRGVGPGPTLIQAGPERGSGIDRVFEIHRGADARIENVGVRYGRAEEAGGIRVWGALTLVGSFVSANDSAASGGGITNNGTLALIDSAVTGNSARYGGGISNFATLTLNGSAINTNSASDDGGGLNTSGTATLVNSTISGNRANRDGGGIRVSSFATSVRMFNVTLVQNTADADGDGNGVAGGLDNQALRALTLRNTLLADNDDLGGQVADCIGGLTSESYNLIESPGCTFDTRSGDIVGRDPVLGTLQGEGLQTHGLNPGSPAIDAGDPAGCMDEAGQPLTLDQRKAPRPSGPRCDIGAFEASAPTPAPGADVRCFRETGFCIGGRIREFWEQNGGLPVFGYPTTAQQAERVEAGTFQVQHFERHRLELHPENARPYDVLLGRLGADQFQQMRVASLPQERRSSCLYFGQTRHTVCGGFASAWRANGLEFDGQPGKSFEESLALFGLPLTNEIRVPLADGKQHIVQYFERARFELHPDNAPPYNVLFGLLDNEARAETLPARPQALLPAPLFFLYKSQIVRLERDGLSPVAVVHEDDASEITTFSVSPDGSQLAYVLKSADGYHLIRTTAAGAHRTEQFFSPGRISTPRWSPNGVQIAIHAGDLDASQPGGVYLIIGASDANIVQPVLRDDNQSSPVRAYLPEGWSPDQRRMLVSAVAKQTEGCTSMVIDIDGQLKALPAPEGQRWACGGAWLPDGRLLVSSVPEGSRFAKAGLWSVDLSTRQVAQFTPARNGDVNILFGPMQTLRNGTTSTFLLETVALPQPGDPREFRYAPFTLTRNDQRLKSSSTHTFAGAMEQLFHVTHRRRAEEPFVLAGEVRGVAVPHAVASACGIQPRAEHETARLLEPQLLLELQGTHRGQRPELVVEARDAHPQLARDVRDSQRLVEVFPQPLDRLGDALGVAT